MDRKRDSRPQSVSPTALSGNGGIMVNYFSTLVGRHLGTENIIQPRLPGRFEHDHSTTTLDTYDGDLNSTKPVVDTPQVPVQEKNRLTSEVNSSLNNQETRQDAPDLTPDLTTRRDEINSANDVAAIDSHSSHQSSNHENKNEFLNRIRSMQSVVGDSKAPTNESALNVADNSLDSVPVPAQTNNPKNMIPSASGENSSASNSSMQPPLWMSELTARLDTGTREKEANADPVINVTIGRVEVRAVHPDSPKKVKQSKKPSGIMPLNEYLKKRESGK